MRNKLFLASLLCLALPHIALAAQTSNQKILSGTVTKIIGSQIFFKTTSAATYAANISGAALTRKFGASMQSSEILIGDKVEIKGTLWPDNSMSAVSVRNLSLYAHTGTFTGKIGTVDPSHLSFTILNMQPGLQTIYTDQLTVFKMNKAASGFKDITPETSVSIRGTWDRNNTEIFATEIDATARLINIEVTGILKMKSPQALTIVSDNNVIYGVDTTSAKLQNKNDKLISVDQLNMDDTIHVIGKHVGGNVQIYASAVKDLSVSR